MANETPELTHGIDQLADRINDSGLSVGDSMSIARLCHTCAVLCEADSPRVAILLAAACELLTRQHLMLQQAKLLPRVEFQSTGSTH